MKTTGLMVDDWVNTPDGNGIIRLINAIDERFVVRVKGMDCWFLPNVVNPIPLIAENIEKNGFEGTPTGDLFIEKNLWETYAIELFPSEGSWLLRITDKTNKYICGCNRINLYINYINELQHALNLCGIDKKIQL